METLSRISSHSLPTLASNFHQSHPSSPSSSTTHDSCRFTTIQNRCTLSSQNRNQNRSLSRNLNWNGTGNYRTRRASVTTCAVPSVTEADFETEVLQATVPVLVDFWATWCGPCRLILPVVEGIQKEYGDKLKVVKIETDPNKNLVEKYKVYGLPTIILFENGEVVPGGHVEGALTKPKLISLIKEKFPSVSNWERLQSSQRSIRLLKVFMMVFFFFSFEGFEIYGGRGLENCKECGLFRRNTSIYLFKKGLWFYTFIFFYFFSKITFFPLVLLHFLYFVSFVLCFLLFPIQLSKGFYLVFFFVVEMNLRFQSLMLEELWFGLIFGVTLLRGLGLWKKKQWMGWIKLYGVFCSHQFV